MFTLELSTTEQCNLACPYCYVVNKPTFLTKETFDNSVDELQELIRRSNNTEYAVSFFGGEPMLNWELIEHATKYFKSDPKCKHLVIITNMTMIDEYKSQFIEDNEISISWSFDGIGSNESRPLIRNHKANEGFNDIMEIYEAKKDLVLKHGRSGCKVMIYPGNAGTMTENLEFLVDWGIWNPDFCIVRDNVWREDHLRTFYQELIKLTDRTIQYFKDGRNVSVGFLSLALQDMTIGLAKGKRPFGCFAGYSGAVLVPEGKFYPCARFASKKLMPMDGATYDYEYWQNALSNLNHKKCDTCRLRQVCNMGCTYSQINNNNAPVDSVCELFHMINEQAMRLLRECKYEPAFQGYVRNLMRSMG